MPDVPWHVGYAKKDEDDPRRHKARCIYYKDSECQCRIFKAYYGRRCPGSSHCDHYSETQLELSEKENIYQQEIERKKRAEKVKQSYIDRKFGLLKNNKKRIAKKLKLGSECPICNSTLEGYFIIVNRGEKKEKKKKQKNPDILHCPYCGAYFDLEENMDKKHAQIVINEGLFFYMRS